MDFWVIFNGDEVSGNVHEEQDRDEQKNDLVGQDLIAGKRRTILDLEDGPEGDPTDKVEASNKELIDEDVAGLQIHGQVLRFFKECVVKIRMSTQGLCDDHNK